MNAHDAGEAVTNYYFNQVGKPRNSTKEFNVLLNWQDAIDTEISESHGEPQWFIKQLLDMKEQCELFLSEIH